MRNLEKGQHIFIAFQNGKAVLDSQLRPRIYTSLENADKWTPTVNKGKIEYVEYAPTLTPPNEPFTVTEVCPNCESEITMAWSTIDNGYKAFCPICGNRLMLCDECQHGEPSFACDYNGATDTCRHNPPDRRPPEGEV